MKLILSLALILFVCADLAAMQQESNEKKRYNEQIKAYRRRVKQKLDSDDQSVTLASTEDLIEEERQFLAEMAQFYKAKEQDQDKEENPLDAAK